MATESTEGHGKIKLQPFSHGSTRKYTEKNNYNKKILIYSLSLALPRRGRECSTITFPRIIRVRSHRLNSLCHVRPFQSLADGGQFE